MKKVELFRQKIKYFFNSKNTISSPELPFKIRKSDTFLLSFPKSGNTWLRFLISNYVAQNPLLQYDELESFIPSEYVSKYKIDSIDSPRIIKTHHCRLKRYPKTLYIVRDGRDALVSYYHYLQELTNFEGSFSEFYYSEDSQKVGTWDFHVRKALDFKEKFPEKIHIVKYEDLKLNTLLELKKIIIFLGLKYDEEKAKESIKLSSFQNLKRIQNKNGIVISGKRINFFRKGTTKQWIDYFGKNELEDFYSRSSDIIESLNYQK